MEAHLLSLSLSLYQILDPRRPTTAMGSLASSTSTSSTTASTTKLRRLPASATYVSRGFPHQKIEEAAERGRLVEREY